MAKSADDMENRARRARQRDISDRLQRLYDQVLQEPIPDDFLRLLEQADRAGAGPLSSNDDQSEGTA